MKITALKRSSSDSALQREGTAQSSMRGTDAQDVAVADARRPWYRRPPLVAGGIGSIVLALVFVWLAQAWSESRVGASLERLRIATVSKDRFVRDVAAQGTVIAAVSPTLFATAPGTITYHVQPGDDVKRDQVLAALDSPALRTEYERERAALESLSAALSRQEIEIRRQMLLSQQQADLAKVAIQAAEREMQRAQWAWDQRVISERDYRRAADEVSTAQLNFEHARETAALERDSLTLDLRTRRLERDRQALLVKNLERRIDELSVRSPVDGRVANLAQAQRAHVAENAPLLTVVDLSALEVEFQVAETYAREIEPGMAAQITIDGRTHAGTVAAISPEVRQSQVTGRVRFAGEQPPGLRQNQRAAVRIVLDERDDVVKFERGSAIDTTTRAVYVVRGDRAVLTPVELGAASVTEIEVIRGLEPGDRVIVSDTREFGDAPELALSD